VLARIWMRLISSDPEFSWTGTLAIIGLAALLGCGAGMVAASRPAGRSLWWTLAVAPGLALFLSPGMLLAPCFLIGALAYARRGRILRALGWAGILLPIVGSTLLIAREPEPGSETTPTQLVTFVIGFALMAITLAWTGSHIWRRRNPRAPRQRTCLQICPVRHRPATPHATSERHICSRAKVRHSAKQ
jgi:hypothetical protein